MKGCATTMLRLDGRAGGPEVQASRTKSSPLPLSQVAIPGLHTSAGLLEWKLVEDMWLNQKWLLLYLSHPTFSDCHSSCSGSYMWGRWMLTRGQEHRPFHSVPETLLSSSDSHQRLFLLTTLSTTPTGACLPLERDWSRDPLTARRMPIPGETCSELSAQPVRELQKHLT